jgi:hypothetical protein
MAIFIIKTENKINQIILPELFTSRGGPQMRGPRGEAVLFGTANPENEADGAESARPKGKKRRMRRWRKKTRRFL